MLLTKRINGVDSARIDAGGHAFQFRDIQGIDMKLEVGIYNETFIKERFSSSTDEEELHRQIKHFDGEFLPYMELEVLTLGEPGAGQAPLSNLMTNEEDEPCFVLEIETQDPARNKALAIFYTEEDGDGEWILANSTFNLSETLRSYEFLIPRKTDIEAGVENLEFGIRGKRVIRIISWVDDLPEDYFEKKEIFHKKYALYHVKQRGPGDWIFDEFPRDPAERTAMWKYMGEGKSLMLVHGTNGTCSVAYGDLIRQKDWMAQISKRYSDRIIAFNHPSVFTGVKHNAKELRQYLDESPVNLDMDFITRSRGALVARHAVEKMGLPGQIRLEKMLMLSGPNQGTASSKGLNKLRTIFIDMHLKKLAKQSNPLRKKLDHEDLYFEIAQVKEKVIENQGKALIQGATDQASGSPFLDELNTGNAMSELMRSQLPKYYAITADFDPMGMAMQGSNKLKRKLRRKLRKSFKDTKNDGIVPTLGAMGEMEGRKISPLFNVEKERCYVLQNSPDTHHINLPESKELRDKMIEYLLQ